MWYLISGPGFFWHVLFCYALAFIQISTINYGIKMLSPCSSQWENAPGCPVLNNLKGSHKSFQSSLFSTTRCASEFRYQWLFTSHVCLEPPKEDQQPPRCKNLYMYGRNDSFLLKEIAIKAGKVSQKTSMIPILVVANGNTDWEDSYAASAGILRPLMSHACVYPFLTWCRLTNSCAFTVRTRLDTPSATLRKTSETKIPGLSPERCWNVKSWHFSACTAYKCITA